MDENVADKELLNRLADMIENLMVEHLVLWSYIKRVHLIQEANRKRDPRLPKAPPPQDLIAASEKTGETRALIQARLRPLRAEIEREQNHRELLEKMLAMFPASKDVN